MEKADLTAYEETCIQEEPAFCTAACPFHVDVKAFMSQMAAQAVDKAFKILEKRLPLAPILARTCDRPCEAECIRARVDTPLAVGALERICAAAGSGRRKPFSLPPKDRHVGILGSGLSSLVAAHDLSLKGYRVTVLEAGPGPGGFLLDLSPDVLPGPVLEQEIARLRKMGIAFRTGETPDEAAARGFDACYMGLDSHGTDDVWIDRDDDGWPVTDAGTCQTLDPRIFAGGFSRDGLSVSRSAYPIAFAAQGRKAATSIDRLLSGVSLTAGREKEGPFKTRLSVDMSRMSPETGPGSIAGIEAAATEAGRCIQCDCARCIRVCAYIEAFKGFPGRYAREIYNNAAIVMGERKANRLVNSCSLCRLCETVCPHDFSMADLCLSARQEMVAAGKMPGSAHEFALGEMAHARTCFFARHAPGADGSDRLFFPGCQLTGSAPFQVAQAYEFLRSRLPGTTGFVSGCCGAPGVWAGREAEGGECLAPFVRFWEASGCPPIVTACTSCTRMLKSELPRARITSLYAEMARAGNLSAPDRGERTGSGPPRYPREACIIDPCTARHDQAVQGAVRKLARDAGITVRELPASGRLTQCCGFGGLVFNANPDLSGEMIRERASQAPEDYLAYCAMCRDRLARTGKPTFHILDLVWPMPDSDGFRQDPGFSRRRDNLAAARHRMLTKIWKETLPEPEAAGPGPIRIRPEVRQVLEDRFILKGDIQKVIARFEKGAPCFVRWKTSIAFFRPKNVCFWVAFTSGPEGYDIQDAWSHHMTVASGIGFEPAPPTDPHDDRIRCAACDAPLSFFKNHVTYLGSRFDVVLPQCGQCGLVFISRDLSLGKMAEVEHILEDK